MTLDAISGITCTVRRDWGDYGYHVESLKRYGWMGGAIAVIAHSDGSRFVLTADRYGNCDLVAEGSELESAALAMA